MPTFPHSAWVSAPEKYRGICAFIITGRRSVCVCVLNKTDLSYIEISLNITNFSKKIKQGTIVC